MKAAVIVRPGLDNLRIEDLPVPEPGPGEVLVRLRADAVGRLGAGRHIGKVCIAL